MTMVQITNVQETIESRFPVALAHRSRVSIKLLVSSGPVLLLCTVLRFVARHIVFLCGHNVAQGGKRHIAWGWSYAIRLGMPSSGARLMSGLTRTVDHVSCIVASPTNK